MRRFLTATDRQFLRWLYPHVQTVKVARLLGRTVEATYGRANIEGHRKTPEFLRSPECGILYCGGPRPKGSVASQFKPGLVPWNKGVRKPGYAPDLRDHLFETLEALKDEDKPMELDRAKTISLVAQTIINSATVEVKFLNAAGQGVATGAFFEDKLPAPQLEGNVTPTPMARRR